MSATSIILLLVPPGVGIFVGYATGGRIAQLRSIRLRAGWLLFLAALLQASQYYIEPIRNLFEHLLGIPMLAMVFALVSIWIVVNFLQWPATERISGSLISLGAALNGLVILLNGKMPYSTAAARQVGLRTDMFTPKNMPSGSNTVLRSLSDIIPVTPLHKIVSLGDILIALGGSSLISFAMQRPAASAQLPAEEGGEL